MEKQAVVVSLAVVSMILTLLAFAPLLAADCGEPVLTPKFQVGEKWTWRDEKGAEWSNEVIQVEAELTQVRGKDGDLVFFDKELIIRKVVQPTGEVVTRQGPGRYILVGQKTLDFPLQVGKQWEFTFLGQPRGGGALQTYYSRSKIMVCEEVSTPAGKFSAFMVEVRQGLVGSPNSGIFIFWYAPQAKNTVRRQYVPSQWWSGGRFLDNELIKFEVK